MENSFSARLKSARESRGLSQGDLARISGFQPSAISHFETGGRSPSIDNLRKLANALQVTTDYLLGRSEEHLISGSSVGKIFRHGANLTEDDLKAIEAMANALAQRNKEREKGK